MPYPPMTPGTGPPRTVRQIRNVQNSARGPGGTPSLQERRELNFIRAILRQGGGAATQRRIAGGVPEGLRGESPIFSTNLSELSPDERRQLFEVWRKRAGGLPSSRPNQPTRPSPYNPFGPRSLGGPK